MPLCWQIGISIHAPAWGARLGINTIRRLTKAFQSTHPHGGATNERLEQKAPSEISIHAPAWGATERFEDTATEDEISIHAPAWGATWAFGWWYDIPLFQSTRPRGARRYREEHNNMTFNFNPRARVGRDLPIFSTRARHHISIHAPAWGATVPVYTGLITAVALYFSRTSFLAVLLQAFFVAKSSV